MPTGAQPSSSAAAALFGSEWTMVEIDHKAVRPADKTHKKIVLTFDAEGTFSGTSGCNDLSGRFTAVEGTLSMRPKAELKICRVDQRTERALRGAINDTRAYRLSGSTLQLLDEKGRLLATLER
jgi:heat shock protein HslJ